MQPDQRDGLARNRKSPKKGLDRRDMGVGHLALEIRLRRLRLTGARDDCAQALRDPLGVGESRGGAGFDPRFAVAHDQRDVDAVHRRAADDADRGRQAIRRSAHLGSVRFAPGAHNTSALPPSLA